MNVTPDSETVHAAAVPAGGGAVPGHGVGHAGRLPRLRVARVPRLAPLARLARLARQRQQQHAVAARPGRL